MKNPSRTKLVCDKGCIAYYVLVSSWIAIPSMTTNYLALV